MSGINREISEFGNRMLWLPSDLMRYCIDSLRSVTECEMPDPQRFAVVVCRGLVSSVGGVLEGWSIKSSEFGSECVEVRERDLKDVLVLLENLTAAAESGDVGVFDSIREIVDPLSHVLLGGETFSEAFGRSTVEF